MKIILVESFISLLYFSFAKLGFTLFMLSFAGGDVLVGLHTWCACSCAALGSMWSPGLWLFLSWWRASQLALGLPHCRGWQTLQCPFALMLCYLWLIIVCCIFRISWYLKLWCYSRRDLSCFCLVFNWISITRDFSIWSPFISLCSLFFPLHIFF